MKDAEAKKLDKVEEIALDELDHVELTPFPEMDPFADDDFNSPIPPAGLGAAEAPLGAPAEPAGGDLSSGGISKALAEMAGLWASYIHARNPLHMTLDDKLFGSRIEKHARDGKLEGKMKEAVDMGLEMYHKVLRETNDHGVCGTEAQAWYQGRRVYAEMLGLAWNK